MAAPKQSLLDANQCIQGAYDGETGRLRTDSEATIVNADINVDIDAASGDNIAISDPDNGNTLKIEADGSINVNLLPGGSTAALQVTGNNAIASIDSKTPALVSGRVPVISEQSGAWNVSEVHPSNSVTTSLNASVTNQTALPSNPLRKGAIIYRQGTGTCYLKLGSNATSSDYTIQMTNNAVYELPFPCYTGRIDVIFSTADGSIKITEIT